MLGGSLSGRAWVVAIVYAILSAIAVIAVDLRLVLIPTAGAVLALVVGGFVIFRPLRCAMALRWPAQPDPAAKDAVVVINGQPCPCQGYEQDLLVALRARRLSELLGCSLLAGAALYVILGPGVGEAGSQIGAFEAEGICICGLAVLLTSLRWFMERRFLRIGRVALGSILSMDPGFIRQGLTYQFYDQQGERRGGHGPLGKPGDNAVLVLYRENDADMNAAHGAFAFHQFDIALLPGRSRSSAPVGTEGS